MATVSDDRLAQARAEAERRVAAKRERMWDAEGKHLSHSWGAGFQAGFREAADWADANPQPADGDTSDGHHTFSELYEYRMLYNAHAAHGWLAQGIPVVKSWRHADGAECFGGGWFVVVADLPAGQVSNHYKAKHWGLFKVPEVDLPPEWDGHTPHDAAMRLRIEAEHANLQPCTITLAQSEAILEAGRTGRYEDHEAALRAAGIEVDGE